MWSKKFFVTVVIFDTHCNWSVRHCFLCGLRVIIHVIRRRMEVYEGQTITFILKNGEKKAIITYCILEFLLILEFFTDDFISFAFFSIFVTFFFSSVVKLRLGSISLPKPTMCITLLNGWVQTNLTLSHFWVATGLESLSTPDEGRRVF